MDTVQYTWYCNFPVRSQIKNSRMLFLICTRDSNKVGAKIGEMSDEPSEPTLRVSV